MDNKLDEIAKEIREHLEKLGMAAWKLGILIIGKDATIDQTSNLLSNKWDMDKETIKNAMNRVKKPWI